LFNKLLELAKIADFGLSKSIDMDNTINISGIRYATPNYAAPEILKSQIGKINEEKSDIYSLGITFC